MTDIRIITIGEALIDLVKVSDKVSDGAKAETAGPVFEANPGGAPANVAVGLARLDVPSGFIGRVGNDLFGRLIRDVMSQAGVNTQSLSIDRNRPTTLAVVALGSGGEREFVFYRSGTADVALDVTDVSVDYLRRGQVLHFGTVSLASLNSRQATLAAVHLARELGLAISLDVNWRPSLWPSREEARDAIMRAVKLADVVKVSREEMEFLTGQKHPEPATEMLVEAGPSLILGTLGSGGCYYRTAGGQHGHIPGILVDAVDTTGAGDAFTAAVWAELLKVLPAPTAKAIAALSEGEARQVARAGNAAGAFATTRRGAIPALPTRAELDAFRKSHVAGPRGN